MIERTRSLQTQLGQRGADRVVLAAGQGAFLYVLGPALKKFCAKDKKRLSLITASQSEALEQIRTGRAHLAVTVLQSVPKDLMVTRLKRITSLLVVPLKHPLANKKKIRLDDLDGVELILPPEPSPMRSDISAVLRSKGIELNVVIEATGWEMMMHFSSLGLGASIINALCPIPKSLRAIPIDGLPPVDYFLVFRKEQYFFPALVQLRDAILVE